MGRIEEKENKEDVSRSLRLISPREVFIDAVTQKMYFGLEPVIKSCFWKILLSLLIGGFVGFFWVLR